MKRYEVQWMDEFRYDPCSVNYTTKKRAMGMVNHLKTVGSISRIRLFKVVKQQVKL